FKCDWSSDVCSSDLAIRVSSWSRLRIAANSRAISDNVSSVLVYSRSCSTSSAFSIATATCAPNWRSIASSLSELARRVAQEIERADHLAFPPERDDQLRPGARHSLQVSRIGLNVVDENRLSLRYRRA